MKNISSSLFGLFAFFAVLIIFGFQISCSNDTKPDKPKTAEKTKEFKSSSNLTITLKDDYDTYKTNIDFSKMITYGDEYVSNKGLYIDKETNCFRPHWERGPIASNNRAISSNKNQLLGSKKTLKKTGQTTRKIF